MNRLRFAIGLTAALIATDAAAADREACMRAYETAQRHRLDGKLVEARQDLLVCAQDSCSAVLRKDCAQWLSEVDAQMPTIAIRVVGVDGCDHPESQIAVDGSVVPHAAEGLAFPIDPGPHVLRATIGEGTRAQSTEQRTVVATNERRRSVTIAFGTATTCTHDLAPSSALSRPSERRPIPTSVFVLGGIGVVAAGTAGVFSVYGWSQKGDLDDCKGACPQADVDAMRRTFAVADIAGVVAIGAVIVAGVLYLTR